jgi:hypothetical protein
VSAGAGEKTNQAVEGTEVNIAWSYVAIGLLTIAAAASVIIGEAASAELRLTETAATAGAEVICFLMTSTDTAANAANPSAASSIPAVK